MVAKTRIVFSKYDPVGKLVGVGFNLSVVTHLEDCFRGIPIVQVLGFFGLVRESNSDNYSSRFPFSVFLFFGSMRT